MISFTRGTANGVTGLMLDLFHILYFSVTYAKQKGVHCSLMLGLMNLEAGIKLGWWSDRNPLLTRR